MKIKATEPFQIRGEEYRPGDVVEVGEADAHRIIGAQRAEAIEDEEKIVNRDPKPKNRDPKPKPDQP